MRASKNESPLEIIGYVHTLLGNSIFGSVYLLKVELKYLKIAMVQCFIHHAKGVQVSINEPKNFKQIRLLDSMYNEAIKHVWQ